MKLSRLSNSQLRRLLRDGEVRFGNDKDLYGALRDAEWGIVQSRIKSENSNRIIKAIPALQKAGYTDIVRGLQESLDIEKKLNLTYNKTLDKIQKLIIKAVNNGYSV